MPVRPFRVARLAFGLAQEALRRARVAAPRCHGRLRPGKLAERLADAVPLREQSRLLEGLVRLVELAEIGQDVGVVAECRGDSPAPGLIGVERLADQRLGARQVADALEPDR